MNTKTEKIYYIAEAKRERGGKEDIWFDLGFVGFDINDLILSMEEEIGSKNHILEEVKSRNIKFYKVCETIECEEVNLNEIK